MNHSQQPSIDIVQMHINHHYKNKVQGSKTRAIIQELEYVKKNIGALKKEPTLEELLEEMPPYIVLGSDDFGWYAEIDGKNNMTSGKTPIEALLALKEKLPINK